MSHRIATEFDPLMRIKRPRVKNEKHLEFVRSLPCLLTGRTDGVEAAHIRYANRALGKLAVGGQEKPSDRWTIPLHFTRHRTDKDAQHTGNEERWWKEQGIDPCIIALALWGATGDHELGELIIREARTWR